MLTPQEVSGKAFPKSSGFSGGYQMSSVDAFLDTLTEDYTALYKENATLKAKLKVLAEKIEEYRATEDAMRSTLLAAPKMAAKLVQEAQEEKDQVLTQAREEAAAQIKELDRQVDAARQRLTLAQDSMRTFLADARALCLKQSEYLDKLPEIPVAAEEEAPAEPAAEPEPEEAPAEPAEAEAEPEEERPEEKDVPTDDTIPLPDDFKLSLEQLKFGRNYNGE